MFKRSTAAVLVTVIAGALTLLALPSSADATVKMGWSYGPKGSCSTFITNTVTQRKPKRVVKVVNGKRKVLRVYGYVKVRKKVRVPGYKEYRNGRATGRCVLQ